MLLACRYTLFFLLLLVLSLQVQPSHCASSTTCTCESSRTILTNFFARTSGSQWQRKWDVNNGSSSVCSWVGISCDGEGVTAIRLPSNSLAGEIPADLLSQLPILQSIDFGSNSLSGTLPDGLSLCTKLVNLEVSQNVLTGTLPSAYSALRNLYYFGAVGNRLSGTFPASYANWTNVGSFVMSSNNFSTTLPAEYSAWRNITSVGFSNCSLYGALPDAWKEWASSIEVIAVDFNPNLTGTLPPSYAAWRRIINFTLSACGLSGTIPREYSQWNASIWQLDLSHNVGVGGTLPSDLSSWASAKILSLSQCQFTGTIPKEWSAMKSLITFSATSNRLTGSLPAELSQWSRLGELSLSGNLLSGTLPPAWAAMTSLSGLYLDWNNLSGTLPSTWSALSNLQRLTLSLNSLVGTLPPSWGTLRLEYLLFQLNPGLTGSIPSQWKSILGTTPGVGFMSICSTAICGASQDITGLFILGFTCSPNTTFAALITQGVSFNQIARSLLGTATFTTSVDCPATPAPLKVATKTVPPPPPPPVPQPVADAAANSAGTLVWVGIGGSLLVPSSSLGSFSAIASLQTSLVAIRLRARCVALSSDSSDDSGSNTVAAVASAVAENPTTLAIPSLGGDYAAAGGSVVGNAIVVIVVAGLLHWLAVWVRPALSRCLASDPHGAATTEAVATHSLQQVLSTSSPSRRAGHFVLGLVGKDRLPGFLVGPYTALVQPSISSSILLLAAPSSSASAGSLAIGIVGVAAWMLPLFLWGLALRRPPMLPLAWDATVSQPRRRERSREHAWLVKGKLLLGPIELWRPTEQSDATRNAKRQKEHRHDSDVLEAQYGPLFLPFRGHAYWFLMADSSFAVLSAIISGAASSVPDSDACDAALWGGWLLVVVAAAQLVAHAYLRPMNCRFDLGIALVSDTLAVVGNVCAVLNAVSVSTCLALFSSVVTLVASLLMFGVAMCELVIGVVSGDGSFGGAAVVGRLRAVHHDIVHPQMPQLSILNRGATRDEAMQETPYHNTIVAVDLGRAGAHDPEGQQKNLKGLLKLACRMRRGHGGPVAKVVIAGEELL